MKTDDYLLTCISDIKNANAEKYGVDVSKVQISFLGRSTGIRKEYLVIWTILLMLLLL